MDYKFFFIRLADISNQLDTVEANLRKYYSMTVEQRKKVKKYFVQIKKYIVLITQVIGENA